MSKIPRNITKMFYVRILQYKAITPKKLVTAQYIKSGKKKGTIMFIIS